MTNLQHEIDSIDYPPTHQYQLDSLEPLGSLRKRMSLIPSEIFHGDRFLDIGSNKGYFSLVAKKYCRMVEAIDNEPKYVDLCNKLGIDTKLTTFREFNPDKKYDRIMMGNVMHYMYRECGDWSFIIKLAAISSGLVLIEAPVDMSCKLMKTAIPKHLRNGFNKDSFYGMMNKFFTLQSISNSPSQGRYIMLWKRNILPVKAFGIREDLTILKKDNESIVYSSDEHVIKLQNDTIEKDEIRIFITSHSPISNGIKYFIYNYGKYEGWVEDKSDQKRLTPFSNQEMCFQKLLLHNIYLAKLGYTEMDMSTSNFWPDGTMYDKGGIRHVHDIHPGAIDDLNTGWFFTMFRNQFDISIDFEKIQTSLKTRNSVKIQDMYQSMVVTEKPVSFGRIIKDIWRS